MESLANVGLVTVQRFKRLEEVKALESVTSQIQEWPANLFRAQFDRFELWAVNLGLFVMGHGSLDYRIRDSEGMRDSIYKMLQNLNRSLDDVLDYVNGNADQGDEDSDTDSELESDTDLLLGSIKDPIDRLYKLAVWIRNPATRLASSKARNFKQIDPESNIDLFESYGNHDYDYVSSLFLEYEKHKAIQEVETIESKGKALAGGDEEADNHDHVWEPIRGVLELHKEKISSGTESYLVRRIAQANGRRRQQFAYWKKHKDKLRGHASSFVEAPTRRLTLEEHVNDGVMEDANTPLSVTTATQLRLAQAAGQEILEREGVLKLDVSEYAPSAWNISKDTVSFPPPPKISTSDNYFECPYCFTICPISLLSEKAWRAHIIRDLRPYVCTHEQCLNSEQLYDTRDDWIQHEISTHQRIFCCFEHEDEIFTTLAAYEEHIQAYHEQNAVSAKFATSTTKNVHRSCPVCSIVLGSVQKLQSHIALHLERFAMFSLPRHTDNSGEQSEAENQSDNAQLESNSFLDLETEWDVSGSPMVPSIHSEPELTESPHPVSEVLLPIYGQLKTIKRCLLEVRDSGGISSVEELYPYSMKLNSIDSLRREGKFVVGGEILEGQGIVSELLEECFKLSVDLRFVPEPGDSILVPYLENDQLDELGQALAGGVDRVINYTKKVKSHFQDKPGIYERFLEILQVYLREQSSAQDLISQVTSIFISAPELLEDLKIILSKLNSSASNPEDIDYRYLAALSQVVGLRNKVKLHFSDEPEIYQQFLEIIQTWQREKTPIPDVYTQLSTLFNSAPDLLEDLKISFPQEDAAVGSDYISQLQNPGHLGYTRFTQDDVHISADYDKGDESETQDGPLTVDEALSGLDLADTSRVSATMAADENSRAVLEDSKDILQSKPPMPRTMNIEPAQPALRDHNQPSSMSDTHQDAEAVSSHSHPQRGHHFPSDVQPLPASTSSSPAEDFESDARSKTGRTGYSTERAEDTHLDIEIETYEEREERDLIEEEVQTFGRMFSLLKDDVDQEIILEDEDAHGGPEARDLLLQMNIYRLEVQRLSEQYAKETSRPQKSEKAQELSTKIRSWDICHVQNVIEDIQANRKKREASMDELKEFNSMVTNLSKTTADRQEDVDEELRTRDRDEADRKVKEDAENIAKADPIKFKDAVGRKFSFPFHLCNTWEGMEELIKQGFMQVDVLRAHVLEGHYDLIGPDGEIILPVVWDEVIEPGWSISMAMWPFDEAPPADGSPYRPISPTEIPPLGPRRPGLSPLSIPPPSPGWNGNIRPLSGEPFRASSKPVIVKAAPQTKKKESSSSKQNTSMLNFLSEKPPVKKRPAEIERYDDLPPRGLENRNDLQRDTNSDIYTQSAAASCFTCRRRRINCDQGRPYCNNCMSSQLPCMSDIMTGGLPGTSNGAALDPGRMLAAAPAPKISPIGIRGPKIIIQECAAREARQRVEAEQREIQRVQARQREIQRDLQALMKSRAEKAERKLQSKRL
ncbi:hypothetical protein ACQKWADRAFT_300391 [Trichoderma austrokoningii]